MKKTYAFHKDGRHPDRVLEAIKHDIRRDMKRQRSKPLPDGTDYWTFNARLGIDAASAEAVHPAALTDQVEDLARSGATACYVELLPLAAVRGAHAPADAQAAGGKTDADAASED